ncbi:MAG: OmpH family outer membrane protein [Fimbriimonadaceae bacterium]|nr:OmpH family outer membrane protein [Chitinophagales bacterium]
MKKILFALLFVTISATTFAQNQRFAYVNTDYILKNIPEFTEAQKKVDKMSEEWKAEVEKKQKEIDDAYRTFQNEQYLMTEDQKKAKIKEIENKEKAIKDYQKQKFGYEGELFQKRQELIKPIQDKVYDAIEKLSKDRGYDFVFDKSGSTLILFADAKNDRSDDILRNLGYTPGSK